MSRIIFRIVNYPVTKPNTRIIKLYRRIFTILHKKNKQSLLFQQNISGNYAFDIAMVKNNWIFIKLALDICGITEDDLIKHTHCHYYWIRMASDYDVVSDESFCEFIESN